MLPVFVHVSGGLHPGRSGKARHKRDCQYKSMVSRRPYFIGIHSLEFISIAAARDTCLSLLFQYIRCPSRDFVPGISKLISTSGRLT
jgi:hypothetical protein